MMASKKFFFETLYFLTEDFLSMEWGVSTKLAFTRVLGFSNTFSQFVHQSRRNFDVTEPHSILLRNLFRTRETKNNYCLLIVI